MGLFDRLLGNDHDRASRYEGRESASETAARKRHERYWRSGVAKAAREGQAWEDADRASERRGRTRVTRWGSK